MSRDTDRPSVFLSYAREDVETVRWEADSLGAVDFEVFFDVRSLRSGDVWPERLREAIHAAFRFILFWSRAASRSEWVQREYEEALEVRNAGERSRFVQIYKLDDTPLPSALATTQILDRSRQEAVVVIEEDATLRQSMSQRLAELLAGSASIRVQMATPRTARIASESERKALGGIPVAPAGMPSESKVSRVYRTAPTAAAAPAVVLVPGFLGSVLARGRKIVWLSPWRLVLGGVRHLRIGRTDVQAVGLLRQGYGLLLDYLTIAAEVHEFAYDWRRSCLDAGRLLAPLVERILRAEPARRPIFVTHGTGSFAVRAFALERPELWAECRRRGALAILLASPELGSYRMVEILLGRSAILHKLGVLDIRHSTAHVHDVFRHFPGVIEALPATQQQDLLDPDQWGTVRRAAPPDAALHGARALRERMRQALDPEAVVHVLGRAAPTPCFLDVQDGRAAFHFTQSGDGQGAWPSGHGAVRAVYASTAPAGSLAQDGPAARAIVELIQHGATTLLPEHAALR